MQDTLSAILAGVPPGLARENLVKVLRPVIDRLSSQTLKAGALRIKGGSASPLLQTNATYVGVANGRLRTVASATDMPALSGTVANGAFNVYAVFIDGAGNRSTVMGLPGATLAAVKFPAIPETQTMMGFVIINPTGTGNFVGGTTALDDATVVPNAVIVDTLGAFDPSYLL
jgi:hypothetical protein